MSSENTAHCRVSPSMMERRWRIAGSVVLAAVTVCVYWPVRQLPFVAYDDPAYVSDNPHVKAGLTLDGLSSAFSRVTLGNWHPLTTLSHMLDCQLFGLDPAGHHLGNLALHALNTVLVFLLLNRTTGTLLRSSVVAALFALHPLHVESVAWVSERKDVLSTSFFLLTMLAYIRYAAGIRPQSHLVELLPKNQPNSDVKVIAARTRSYLGVCCLFILALLSKPMVVSLPLILLLLDYWPLGRAHNKQDWKGLALEKLPLAALALLDCTVTVLAQKTDGAMDAATAIGVSARISNAIVSYLAYVLKTLCPMNLAVFYPHPALTQLSSEKLSLPQVLIAASVLTTAVWFSVKLRRIYPWLPVGWFWFMLTLVPVIGVMQVGEQAMADRYMYIPSIGLNIVLVWGLFEAITALVRKLRLVGGMRKISNAAPYFFLSLAFGALTCMALMTRNQLKYWRSTTTLFQHALVVTGPNPITAGLLAVGLEADGRVEEAIKQYRIAINAKPEYHSHLAQLLAARNQSAEASEHFAAALQLNPSQIDARLGLAQMLQELDKNEAAAEQLETVLRQDPNSVAALNNLAWLRATCAQSAVRNGNQAVDLASHACELTKFGQTILIGTLAAAYAEAGRFDDAITTAQRACDLAFEKGEHDLLTKNQELLQLYKAHKPFHESPAGAVQ